MSPQREKKQYKTLGKYAHDSSVTSERLIKMRLNPKIPIQSFECSSPSVGVKDGCLLSPRWQRRAVAVSLDSAHYNGDHWWHFHCCKNILKHLSNRSCIAINSAVRLSVQCVPDAHCCAWIWPNMWLVLDIWASWRRHLAIILVV